jgi:RNA polymerase-associated protein CTR9
VWKKDYDRVLALAKGAYNSTSVQDIQAESLFFLARVYHVRDDLEHAHQFYDRACKLSPNLSPARFGLAQTLIAQEEYAEAAAHLQLVLGTSNTATDALATLGLLEVKSGDKTTEGLANLRKAIDLDPLNPDLILLEALALQQHDTNYPRSLERYKKAVQLMERQGKKIPFEIYTNIGVLCHETKSYDESLKMYRLALDAADDEATRKVATMENVGIEGGRIRHADNSMFFDYVDTTLQVEYETSEEGTTSLKVTNASGKTAADIGLLSGDHVRVGESFESQVVNIVEEGGTMTLELKDRLKTDDKPKDNDESKERGGDEAKEGESKEKESGEGAEGKTVAAALFVKRENGVLDQTSAISIAFNLARLHEVVGRTLAAVELHKAILKRNPAYVNSYLRLACIAIDCGALKECASWLKIAAVTAPGNPEVLTLIGNLHLSLCDWAPAQQVFDGLLTKKVQNVEAYAMLSLGNIYFANLKIPDRYAKHIVYAAEFYKGILKKDTANAYAANGLGTVLAEKGELFKAKEVFNRVREVSGDTIADAHLNLGHVYLAQKRHPEALQMYQSYLKRTEDGSAPITSKSRTDDKVDVLMYIAFAYFDWARQTELFNNAKAAPADERYKKAMEHLELALKEDTSKNIVLTYNLCMTKLQAANCVLQKLTRNIRRTAAEVEEALNGLQKSYETVEEILKKKSEGLKVTIATSMLNDFLTHCKSNIESAKSHLEDERKREEETNELRELQRLASESKAKEEKLREQLKMEEEAKKHEEQDRRVRILILVFVRRTLIC